MTTLEGAVAGYTVKLQSTDTRFEGDFESPCTQYITAVGRIEFEGQVSPDGKTIQGPYDHSGQPSHTWTLTR